VLCPIVAGRLDTAGERLPGFQTGDIIALPAVHGNRQPVELAQGLFDINAYSGKALFSEFPGLFKLSGHAQSSFVCRFC
jgi:hypothetical protein